jgi:multicomponent Na+:H+ antiporter subunit G
MSGSVLDIVALVLSSGLMIFGVLFVLAGTIGVLRLPDFYTRTHAAGITDTLGAEMILLSLMIQSGFSQTSLKLMLVGFFLFLTSPTATHAVANAAYNAGLKPLLGKFRAPSPDEFETSEKGKHK